MHRNQHGFTLVEITAVLVLMAIISAYVIGRSVDTEQIDIAAQTDRIRNQIRYTQATAMKQYDDTLKVWGLKCDAGANQYWLFQGQNPDDAARQINFPGEPDVKISLADRGVASMTAFTLFFDRFGAARAAVERNDAIALGILDMIGKHGCADIALCGLANQRRQTGAVEDIVAEDQGHRATSDELPPDDESVRQAVRLRLFRV